MTQDRILSEGVVLSAVRTSETSDAEVPSAYLTISEYLRVMIALRRSTSIVLEPALHNYMGALIQRCWSGAHLKLSVEFADLIALATTELHQAHMADIRKALLDNRVAYPTFVGPLDGRNEMELTEKWAVVKNCCDLFDVLFFCVQHKREVLVEWK